MSEAERERIDTIVGWEIPPPEGRNKYDWHAIADVLRSKPGTWAKIFDDDRVSIVNALRQGSVRVLAPSEGYEVRTRNNVRYPERRCTLYMRWNPDQVGD